MNKLTISLTIFAMALTGCGDDDRPGDIVIPDSGTTDMGPVGTDMGGTDSGSGPRMCEEGLPNLVELNMDPMAMGMLLPRCEAGTVDCINDCTDTACQTACLEADTTPGVDIGGGQVLNCETCFNVQFNACLFDACPSEGTALLCCAEDNGCGNDLGCAACSAENSTFGDCAMPAASGCFTPDYLQACFAM